LNSIGVSHTTKATSTAELISTKQAEAARLPTDGTIVIRGSPNKQGVGSSGFPWIALAATVTLNT